MGRAGDGLTRDERRELARAAAMSARPRASGWWRALCPICPYRIGKDDTSGTFSFHPESGHWHCWRCSAGGSLSDDEVEQVRERSPDLPPREGPQEWQVPPEGFLPLWKEPGKTALVVAPAREYLLGRHVPPALWDLAQIGATARGRYHSRIVMPALAGDGETWLGWIARSWAAKADKTYLNPGGPWRGSVLYNHVALLEETDRPAILVEGAFDAFPFWPDGVAALGLSGGTRDAAGRVTSRGWPTETQAEALAAARRPIAVVLDGDAWEGGWAFALKLRLLGARAGAVRLPPKVDPDEVDRQWVREQAAACIGSDTWCG